jgi:hypothetical protein
MDDFNSVLLVAGCFMFSTRILKATSSHVFALLLSAFVVYFYKNIRANDTAGFHAVMERRYSAIGEPSHLHMDSNLINILFVLLEWRRLNPDAYDNLVDAVNNVLRIEAESQNLREGCYRNFQVASEQTRAAMNHTHAFVYSIERGDVDRLSTVLDQLSRLLQRHLRTIKENCDRQTADVQTTSSPPDFRFDAPGPHDEAATFADLQFSMY